MPPTATGHEGNILNPSIKEAEARGSEEVHKQYELQSEILSLILYHKKKNSNNGTVKMVKWL